MPYLPVLVDEKNIFGANSICRWIAKDKLDLQWNSNPVCDYLDFEEFQLKPLVMKLLSTDNVATRTSGNILRK